MGQIKMSGKASDQEDNAEKKLEPGAEIIWTKSFSKLKPGAVLWVRQAPKVRRTRQQSNISWSRIEDRFEKASSHQTKSFAKMRIKSAFWAFARLPQIANGLIVG
jgi:hypothetical protein